MNFGIICEFNPFHAGHRYLLDSARGLGAENIICAMSGNAVQRGELAIADKYGRAKSAIENGADLVLELPFPWSSASAEYFALAGIKALAPFCDAIIFGSECGDIEILKRAASSALTEDFCDALEKRKKNGEGSAAAYFSLIEESVGVKLSSNDILGVEYIKAAKKIGAELEFYTVKRMGSAYRDNNIQEGKFPSASAIRLAIRSGEDVSEHIDDSLASAIESGTLTDVKNIERALLLHFRLCDASELSEYAECDGGIAERICSAARNSADIEELWRSVRTKRYTDAKLNRAMIFALARVRRELLLSTPEYLYLLAANERGRAVISGAKRSKRVNESAIRIVTKPADVMRESEQFRVEERLNALFSLSTDKAFAMSEAYKKKAFIIK